MVIWTNDVHSAKDESPIDVTDSGISINTIILFLKNAYCPIIGTDEGSDVCFCDEILLYNDSSILGSDNGMNTLASELHSPNI